MNDSLFAPRAGYVDTVVYSNFFSSSTLNESQI